ncbi:MAG: hypothetical protein ACFFE8_03900 [Candidatus Heimdallarchaeota archaeon]
MEIAEKVGSLVTDFVASLEGHPNGAELITLVERVLAGENQRVDPMVIANLKQLSNSNLSLLVDFWILRGHIMREEGHEQAAFKTFMEAAQWEPRNIGTWMRLVEIFVQENELFKAMFVLQQAQEMLGLDNRLQEVMAQIEGHVRAGLIHPPGIDAESKPEVLSVPVPTLEESRQSKVIIKGLQVTDGTEVSEGSRMDLRKDAEVDKVWELAVECYEGAQGENLVYRHAFVHYAHATVRKLLGIEGKFTDELERKVAQFGLFNKKSFLKWLNHLRNRVSHEDYMPTPEEIRRVYAEVSALIG